MSARLRGAEHSGNNLGTWRHLCQCGLYPKENHAPRYIAAQHTRCLASLTLSHTLTAAALMKHNISDAQALGWKLATDSPSHDWETLRKLVQRPGCAPIVNCTPA